MRGGVRTCVRVGGRIAHIHGMPLVGSDAWPLRAWRAGGAEGQGWADEQGVHNEVLGKGP